MRPCSSFNRPNVPLTLANNLCLRQFFAEKSSFFETAILAVRTGSMVKHYDYFVPLYAFTLNKEKKILAQGCIFRLTCSHPELTEDHVLASAYVKIFRAVTRNAVNKSVWMKKRLFLTSLKETCNEYMIKFSENQSAPKLENRKTSPCSPCAPNLLHVLVSWIPGYHNLCSPGQESALA